MKRIGTDRRYRFGLILPPIFEDGLPTRQRLCRKPPNVFRPSDSTRSGKHNQGDSTGREGQFCLSLARLPADMPSFTVPVALVRILDLDLVAAGIARRVEVSPGKWKIDKRDERGRTVDVHALRHTFGTLLSAAGVAPRVFRHQRRHLRVIWKRVQERPERCAPWANRSLPVSSARRAGRSDVEANHRGLSPRRLSGRHLRLCDKMRY
jgi:hypothetical protein